MQSEAQPTGTLALLIGLRGLLRSTRRSWHHDPERGAGIVEWVIIIAVLAGLAIAVGAIIVSKVTTKANGINLGS